MSSVLQKGNCMRPELGELGSDQIRLVSWHRAISSAAPLSSTSISVEGKNFSWL